jgi:hypothetical protein
VVIGPGGEVFAAARPGQIGFRFSTAAEAFGPGHVAGSRAHLGIDVREDHLATMLDVARAVMRDRHDHAVLAELLHEIGALFRAYFTELHHIALATEAPA